MAKPARTLGKTWWEASVAPNGATTLPAEARRVIGLESGGQVLIFAEPEEGRLVITPAPLHDELLAFATKQAIARLTKSG